MSLGEVVFGSWETSDMTNPSRSTRNSTKWMPPDGSAEHKGSRFYALQFALAVMISRFCCNEFSHSGKWLLTGILLRLTQRTHYLDCFYFSAVQCAHLVEFVRNYAIWYFNNIFISTFGKMSNLRIVSPQNYSEQTIHRKRICILLTYTVVK